MYLKMNKIKKILECVVYCNWVKNPDKLVSVLLIAPPESTKTNLIKYISQYPTTYYINDVSFKMFVDVFLPMVEDGNKSILTIPDFINVVSHRKAFESLLPVLNSFLEEGLKDLKYYGVEKKFKHAVKGCLITAITKDIFERKIITLKNIGFITRVIPITYSYSNETISQIHKSIQNQEYLDDYEEKIENIPQCEKIEVTIPDEISEKLNLLCESVIMKCRFFALKYFSEQDKKMINYQVELSRYGFRLHKQLRTLLKGICLFNSKFQRNTVNDEDFEDLKEFSNFINFDFSSI